MIPQSRPRATHRHELMQVCDTGLFVLPYIFGGELWPNRIRSFGGALSQTFHWLFIYAINYSVPPLLKATDNWGAFLFFAGWCFFALFYVFFMVPEIAGLGVEEIDHLFKGSWFNAYRRVERFPAVDAAKMEDDDCDYVEELG